MRRLRDWLTCFVPAVPWLITAGLIVAVLMILVSALRPKAHAQFGGVQQPMFSTPSETVWDGTVLGLGDVAYYWRSDTNVTLNGDVVTNWLDIVALERMKHGSAATSTPTNSATQGIFFDGFNYARWFTNNMNSLGTNFAVAVILRKGIRVPNATEAVINANNSGVAGTPSIRIAQANTNLFVSISSPGTMTWTVSPALGTASLHDSIMNFAGAGGGTATSYWAGVTYSTTNNTQLTNSAGFRFRRIAAATDDNYYIGYFREIVFFTNTISAIQVSNFHYYATNTYGFTP